MEMRGCQWDSALELGRSPIRGCRRGTRQFFPALSPLCVFFNLFVVPFLYSLIVYKLYSILVQRLLFLNVFYVFLNRELELYEKINFNKLYIDINKYEFITHLC